MATNYLGIAAGGRVENGCPQLLSGFVLKVEDKI